MTQVTYNIFDALLTYRPRESRSSKENFLTEAFAHTLRTHPDVCRAWLSELSGVSLDVLSGPLDVQTQDSATGPGGSFRSVLDMIVSCHLANGGEMRFLFEHKWDSAANCDQLDRYVKIAATMSHAIVVFIAPKAAQVAEVRRHARHNQVTKLKAIHWYDVQRFLGRMSNADRVREFAEFLMHQGLCGEFCPPFSAPCPMNAANPLAFSARNGWSCAELETPCKCEPQSLSPRLQRRKIVNR